jgi:lysophospholipase L1-like esterase
VLKYAALSQGSWIFTSLTLDAPFRYYHLPWISFRDALYQNSRWKGVEASRYHLRRALTEDGVHPNDLGQKMMADMVIWMIQQVR